MPPKRALVSQLCGRFHGLPSTPAEGGTGFGLRGAVLSQAVCAATRAIAQTRRDKALGDMVEKGTELLNEIRKSKSGLLEQVLEDHRVTRGRLHARGKCVGENIGHSA